MTTTDFLKAQLAVRAFRDGGSEGLNGMLAICFCFRNRIRAGWWNGKWASVLEHFRDADYRSVVDDTAMPNPESNYSLFLLLQQLDGIFDGTTPDNITVSSDIPPPLSPQYVAPVALFYARLDQVTSDKFLTEVCRNPDHKRVATVGALTFFS